LELVGGFWDRIWDVRPGQTTSTTKVRRVDFDVIAGPCNHRYRVGNLKTRGPEIGASAGRSD